MKKLRLLTAILLLIALLVGCGGKEDPEGIVETPPADGQSQSEGLSSNPEDAHGNGDSQSTNDTTDETGDSTDDTTEETTLATDPPVVVIGYDMSFPEGFEPSVAQNDLVVYLSPKAPMDTSAVTVEQMEADESVLALDEDKFLDSLGEDVDAFVNEIRQTEIDGFSALFVDYTVDNGDFYTRTLVYYVVATDNYVFTFTDSTDDNEWLESYKACAETIVFIQENQGISLDYSSLELYELECGISLYAIPGLQVQDAEGFTACLGNHDMIILAMEDNKETNDLVGLTLQEYAGLVSQTNKLDQFDTDNYGSLQTSFYTTDETGMEYYNMLTVKETEESFWVFQLACVADDQASLAKDFSLICSSITEK